MKKLFTLSFQQFLTKRPLCRKDFKLQELLDKVALSVANKKATQVAPPNDSATQQKIGKHYLQQLKAQEL